MLNTVIIKKSCFSQNILVLITVFPLAMLLSTCSPNPLAETLTEMSIYYQISRTITTDEYTVNDGFGFDVAICSPYLAVGIPFFNDNAGVVRVYDMSTSEWIKDDGGGVLAGDMFGRSVDLAHVNDGFYLIVGAPGVDNQSGEAYVWNLIRSESDGEYSYDFQAVSVLRPDIPAIGDRFGWDVAIDGEQTIVGAYLSDTQSIDSGAAYIFELDEVAPAAKVVLPSDGLSEDWFGYSVDIHSGQAIVGAYRSSEGSGSAYVFEQNGEEWGVVNGFENWKLLPSEDIGSDSLFGWSVSIYDSNAIVGAIGGDDGGAFRYHHDHAGWMRQEMLQLHPGDSHSRYGYDVTVNEDLIAAVSTNEAGEDAALSVFSYVFDSAWVNSELTIPGGVAPQFFSVDSDDTRIALAHYGEEIFIVEKVRTGSE